MSRIEGLINEQCRNGVPFLPLGALLDYEQPSKYLVASTNYDNSYATPVLTAGQTFLLGYTNETFGLYPASRERPVMIFDDFTTAFKWVDFPFKAKSSAMKMLTLAPGAPALLRYVYYAMLCINFVPQDHARQWIANHSQFRIPIPPLEVQREIVKILDTFRKLEAELEAELEARQVQYAFYRDALVTSASHSRAKMGEVGSFQRGKRFTKSDAVEGGGIPSIHYGEIYTHYGVSAKEAAVHVRPELREQLRFAQSGDVVIATVGETVEDVAKAVAWLGTDPVAIHDDTALFRSELNPKYVSYAMQTADFHAQKEKYVARGKVKRVSGEGLSKIVIPIPSREEQARIVAILDKFDALVNDRSIGIPAELGARRKQLEHYRNRLLTFQEAG